MKKLFTLLMFTSLAFLGKAQWNLALDQNLLVTNPGSGSSFAATTSDGKTYIGYWKSVPAPVNFELWVQILDVNGNKVLTGDGVMLSNQIPMSTYTVFEKIAVDASDNFYIGVTGTGDENTGYVFKITPQGTSVWPGGINLGEAYLPTILPLSNGDIIVGYYPPSQKYTKLQRFNSSGQPVWANPVQIISDDPSKNTIPADLFELSDNQFEIIFHKQISFGTASYLFAQKLSQDGTVIWNSPKQVSTKSVAYNADYSGAADGGVVYYGYSTGESSRFDGFLQKINTDGSLPWGPAGVDFDTNQTYFEKDMKMAFTPGSPYVWAIANYSTSSQGQNGEFVQKFDKNTGARLLTDHGKQVFPIDDLSMFHYGNLFLVNDMPYFVVRKKAESSVLDFSLNAVQLNGNGNFAWNEQYLPFATFSAPKSYISPLKPINGQAVIVFQEKKTTDNTEVIYAQNLKLPANNLAVNETEGKKNSIKIYPNPAVDHIYVEGIKDQEYAIYNTAGQLVKSETMNKKKIEIKDLVKGNYILKIKEKQEGLKFIKK